MRESGRYKGGDYHTFPWRRLAPQGVAFSTGETSAFFIPGLDTSTAGSLWKSILERAWFRQYPHTAIFIAVLAGRPLFSVPRIRRAAKALLGRVIQGLLNRIPTHELHSRKCLHQHSRTASSPSEAFALPANPASKHCLS